MGSVLLLALAAVIFVPWQLQAVTKKTVSTLRCEDDPSCEAQLSLEGELRSKGDRLLTDLKRDIDQLLLDPDKKTSEVKSDVLDTFETYKKELRTLYDEYKQKFLAVEKGVRLSNQAEFVALLDAEYEDRVKWADFAIKLSLLADAEEKKTFRIVTKLRGINERFRKMSDLVADIREELDRLNAKLPCTSQTCI